MQSIGTLFVYRLHSKAFLFVSYRKDESRDSGSSEAQGIQDVGMGSARMAPNTHVRYTGSRQHAEVSRRSPVNANDAMRAMIETSGKSGRQVAREIGRSESFVSSTLAQGVCPRADTLARVAEACGYKIVIVPTDVASNLLDGSGGIVVEYGGR